MDNIEIFDRIPTATHPLEKHYMLPITQFLHQWINDELFYIDFVDLAHSIENWLFIFMLKGSFIQCIRIGLAFSNILKPTTQLRNFQI